jgi:Ca2+/H+ antiporter, TMEM165/GDT1 family
MDFGALGASFAVIFLMEMGDKSQLAVLSLAARTQRTLAVFIGASLGLAAVTAPAVAAGGVAAELVPAEWLSRIAGAVFIGIGLLILWSAWTRGGEKEGEEVSPGWIDRFIEQGRPWTIGLGTFGLMFLLEMGDKTQIAAMGLTAQTGSPVAVFIGAALAMTVVTGLAVIVGMAVVRVVPVRWITVGAGAVFVIIGVLTLAGLF